MPGRGLERRHLSEQYFCGVVVVVIVEREGLRGAEEKGKGVRKVMIGFVGCVGKWLGG